VLTSAVADGAASLLWRSETFAYAAAKEPSPNEGEPARYLGLVGGRHVVDPPAEMSHQQRVAAAGRDTAADGGSGCGQHQAGWDVQ
jgi:hypothetical protein